ncbi:MAG: hypothetical protein ACOC28_03530, partial [Alkalispirochaetaceae bacterium]
MGPTPAGFCAPPSGFLPGRRRRRSGALTAPGAFLVLLLLPFLTLTPLAAQDEAPPPADPPEAGQDVPSSERTTTLTERTLAQDILTAGFRDLIAWNASLDLSTRGGRRELEDRLFDYYGVPRPEEEEREEGNEIIIEAARSSRYFTLEAPEEEYLVLRGGVIVQMREAEGDVRHRIAADQVIYNQERNTLSALGDITYTVEGDGTTETFTGRSLQFSLDSWDGVFIDGESRRQDGETPEDEEFAVRGRRLSRSPEEITVVEQGRITSSLADPPNYSIDATKIWVLAPGEWGIQNAVLKVGRVPVFYFPFFFLPGDKLFFHPSVGYEPRRGTFIQTTTYLVGAREEQDQAFSLLQLSDSGDEALREIQGLFLVLPDDPEPPERPDWYFKVMADLYTTLGGYVGLETDLPDLAFLDTFFLRTGLGASRTVFSQGSGFTPFFVNEEGEAESNWESGWFFGRELPLRYEAELNVATSTPTLSLSLEMLLLSDPEFRRDFGVRQEQFDWSVILSGLDPLEQDEQERIESYTWRLQSSVRPPVTPLEPLLSNLALERLNASLEWQSRQWPTNLLPLSLQRNSYTSSGETAFFFPSQVTAPDASLRVEGELFGYPFSPRERSPGDDGGQSEQLRPPWEEAPGEEGEEGESPGDEEEPRLPPPLDNREGILGGTPLQWRLRYQVVPTLTIDNVTDSDDWLVPEDIDGSLLYSNLRHQGNYELSHSGYLYDELITFSGSLLLAIRYQELLQEEGLEEAEKENLEEQAFRGRSRRLTQSQDAALAPLRSVERLEASRLRYSISTLLYERTFEELDPEGAPVYEEKTIEVTDEFFQTHRTAAELRVRAWRETQSLTLTSDLPPLDGRYDGSATAVTGPLTTTVSTSYVEDPQEEQWRFEPLETSQRLTIIEDDLSLAQRFRYQIEEERLERSVTTLDAWITSLSYEARRSEVYTFEEGEGWSTRGEEEFQPFSLTASVDGRWDPPPFWKGRIRPEAMINASYQASLVRFTESALRLNYGLSLSIYRFLDLQFEAVTVNDFTYQYIPSLPQRVGRERRSLARDLLNSFALFDRERREESFFE